MGKVNSERWAELLRGIGWRGKVPDGLTEDLLEKVRAHPLDEAYSLADRRVPGVTRDAIEKALADRKEASRKAGTLLRDWSAFRAMLADAVDRGHLAAVPTVRRPEPIRKLRGNQRVRYLGQRDTEEERAAKNGEA